MRLVCSHLCQMVSHFRVASRHGESCQEAREEPKKRGEMVTGDMNTQTSTFYHGRVWPPFTFYHVCGVEGRASRWERSVTVRGGEGRRQEPLDACRGDCQWPTTRTPPPRAIQPARSSTLSNLRRRGRFCRFSLRHV